MIWDYKRCVWQPQSRVCKSWHDWSSVCNQSVQDGLRREEDDVLDGDEGQF